MVKTLLLPLLILLSSVSKAAEVSYYVSNQLVDASNITLYQRQMLEARITFKTRSEFAYINFNTFNVDGLLTDFHIEKVKNTASISLYLWPLNTSQVKLNLPRIELFESGRAIEVFLPTLINLNVKPLPAYLPPTIPVGTLSIVPKPSWLSSYNPISKFSGFNLYSLNTLIDYPLYIQATNIHPALLPNFLAQLSSPQLVFTETAINNKQISKQNRYLLQSTQTGRLFSTDSQWHLFKPIRVMYFDPQLHKLHSFEFQPVSIITLNTMLQIMLWLIFISIVLLIIRTLLGFSRKLIHLQHNWHAIKSSSNAKELSASLRRLTSHQNNQSLLQWAKQWQDDEILQACQQLLNLEFNQPVTTNTEEQLISIQQHLIYKLRFRRFLCLTS